MIRALRADPATTRLRVVLWSSDPAVQVHVAALNLAGVTAMKKQDAVGTLQAVLACAADTVARTAG